MPSIPSPASFAPQAQNLPRRLLFSTSAGIGGHGLNSVSLEILKGVHRAGYLGRAIAFSNHQSEIPANQIQTLWWHPARLLKFLPRKQYAGARKLALDNATAKTLAKGDYDMFHSWSGDCLASLKVANRLGIPSLLEIPTWHRDKGKVKARVTRSEQRAARLSGLDALRYRLEIPRPHTLEEYDRASVILVLSEKARETFLTAGFDAKKLFLLGRGVDVSKFQPAESPPAKFHAVFVGSVIRRKGAHLLIQAWDKLRLPDAELTLVGAMEPAVREVLEKLRPPGVNVVGFCHDVAPYLRRASVHVFPTECEGSAKVTYEAAASGLAQITTREAGDVVQHGKTGWIIPPNNLDALCDALQNAANNPDTLHAMGSAARQRMVDEFTWQHFHQRLDAAHAYALSRG